MPQTKKNKVRAFIKKHKTVIYVTAGTIGACVLGYIGYRYLIAPKKASKGAVSQTVTKLKDLHQAAKPILEEKASHCRENLAGLFGKKIYSTNEWHGHGKQNYFNNDYYLADNVVTMVQHHRQKVFFGDCSEWVDSDKIIKKWTLDAPDLPDWLWKHI